MSKSARRYRVGITSVMRRCDRTQGARISTFNAASGRVREVNVNDSQVLGDCDVFPSVIRVKVSTERIEVVAGMMPAPDA